MEQNNKPVGIIQDDNGNVSSTRIIKLGLTILVMSIWSFICVIKGEMIEIPDSALIIVLGSLGIGTLQKFAENKIK